MKGPTVASGKMKVTGSWSPLRGINTTCKCKAPDLQADHFSLPQDGILPSSRHGCKLPEQDPLGLTLTYHHNRLHLPPAFYHFHRRPQLTPQCSKITPLGSATAIPEITWATPFLSLQPSTIAERERAAPRYSSRRNSISPSSITCSETPTGANRNTASGKRSSACGLLLRQARNRSAFTPLSATYSKLFYSNSSCIAENKITRLKFLNAI